MRETQSLGVQAERLGARRERSTAGQHSSRIMVVVGGYLAAGGVAWGSCLALGRDPLSGVGWLGAPGAAGGLLSLGLCLPIGAATIVVTRVMVRKAAWAHALHVALRPAVHGVSDAAVLALATASATGEELLFRGLLVPAAGVVVSALIFGALHQVRGRGRLGWMAWATVMGILFGEIFLATGNLAGPIVAHAIINHANLRFLRDHDPEPRARPLGGLLRRARAEIDGA